MKKLFFIFFLFVISQANAQKRPIKHSDYDAWTWIKGRQISNDGKYISYIIGPQKGIDTLFIETFEGDFQMEFPMGRNPQFSWDSKFLKFLIGDTISTFNTKTREIKKYAEFENLNFPEKSGRFSGSLYKQSTSEGKQNTFVLTDLQTGKTTLFTGVLNYAFSANGETLLLNKKVSDTEQKIAIVDLSTMKNHDYPQIFKTIKSINFSGESKQIAFIATTNERTGIWLLDKQNILAEIDLKLLGGINSDFEIKENSRVSFNKAGDRLYVGLIYNPQRKKLPEQSTPNVELWSYTDDLIYTQQQKELNQLANKNFISVCFLNENRALQVMGINDDEVQFDKDGVTDYALVNSAKDGKREGEWKEYTLGSAYLVSLKDGSRKQIHHLEAVGAYENRTNFKTWFSPAGKYIVWYKAADEQYYSYNVATGDKKQISINIPESLANLDEGVLPRLNEARGIACWLENDEAIYVNGNRDIWKLDPLGKKQPVSLSANTAIKQNIKYNYFDAPVKPKGSEILVYAFDYNTKYYGFMRAKDGSLKEPELLNSGPYEYSYPGLAPAEFTKRYIISRGNSDDYQLYATTDLKNFRQITHQNPQKKNFNWYKPEVVKWQTPDGVNMQGLLYKPEDFSPNKKYPVMVYFYEYDSKNLYEPRSPDLTGGRLDVTYYASNGYLVFMPDINYKIGEPGQSVVNSVMSGIKSLEKNTWFDSSKMGLQGHSWGAHQSLFLLTQTNKFKAADIGATVGDIISAYGSIRGLSGNSRHWVYENSQSRIGKSLWEDKEAYIRNNPLFMLDKIETPLLLLHNDQDQNVPFAQGFQLYTNLKRLGKKVWLLNYVGEQHVLRNRVNQLDYSVRMSQFFNHHLKGEVAPSWMLNGIPAIDKGYTLGYDLK